MRFENKVLVITGASSGVGRSTSLMAAEEGAKVYSFARRKEKLEALAEEAKSLGYKGEIIPVAGDVSKQEDVDRLFEKVKNENDKLDVLIANAGIMDKFEPVTHCQEETFDRIFEVNVKGSFRLFKSAIPLMTAGGSIVATTSIAGIRGGKAGVAYTMSKSAIHGLVRSTAAMYANNKIRCNAVAPGGIQTEILENLNDVDEKGIEVVMRGPKLDKMVASAEEIAANLLFLVSDQASNINGQILISDGGLTNM